MKYGIGDELVLKIDSSFGYSDKTYRYVPATVIGYDNDVDSPLAYYLCYLYPDDYVQNCFTITDRHIKVLHLDKKFLGDNGIFITAKTPVSKHTPATPGERCQRCKEFIRMACANVNGVYFCRACRENPYR